MSPIFTVVVNSVVLYLVIVSFSLFFVSLIPVLVVNLCFYFFVFIPALVLPFYSIKLYVDNCVT